MQTWRRWKPFWTKKAHGTKSSSLGDAVVGGPQPNEVLSVLADLKGIFLMGNHDREILHIDLASEALDTHLRWKQWTRQQLSPANVGFLSGFVDSHRLRRQGHDLRLIHGELPSKWGGRLWPDSPEAVFTELGGQYPEPWILLGHSHIQFRQIRAGKTIINPGSVGQSRLGHGLGLLRCPARGRVGPESGLVQRQLDLCGLGPATTGTALYRSLEARVSSRGATAAIAPYGFHAAASNGISLEAV